VYIGGYKVSHSHNFEKRLERYGRVIVGEKLSLLETRASVGTDVE
jgi:hypothetical protein